MDTSARATGQMLAVDLDGTLIPLDGNRQNRADLDLLKAAIAERGWTLVFVTGRHLESVLNAITEYNLPSPDWIICDVGSSIFEYASEIDFAPHPVYHDHLNTILPSSKLSQLREHLDDLEMLRLQESEKQGEFKLSYYTDADQLDEAIEQIDRRLSQDALRYSLIGSVDPFNDDGLIDLLPADCSKAYALQWLVEHLGAAAEDICFAGDSGNDFQALTAGFRAILVGNAPRQLARDVYDQLRARNLIVRLFLASQPATSGVLQGCRWFGWLDAVGPDESLLGAQPVSCNQTHFRVWAPAARAVQVELKTQPIPRMEALQQNDNGYFSRLLDDVPPGTCYCYHLDQHPSEPRTDGPMNGLPDPASRYQPQGIHGVSQVIDPWAFAWTDQDWRGVPLSDLIFYELHTGTFTESGTLAAAIERLPELVELGVTAIELMPLAQSPGRWNWGYDGVSLYSVCNNYGQPDDFKALVDACHALGLAVILDVVYNHMGPEGNYLPRFGPYASPKHRTPWGAAFNYDGPGREGVRNFILQNAWHWLVEYHLDGLRLDAAHFMFDDSQPSILQELHGGVAQLAETLDRPLLLIGETNVFDDEIHSHRPDGPWDAIWCDCLMHSIYSFADPRFQFSHRHYRGISDIVQAMNWGFVYRGRQNRRAEVPSLQPDLRKLRSNLVVALQNHDAVGNHPNGKRIHHLSSIEFQKAAATLILLHPGIPLIFMGEEFAADSRFPFFVDFEDPQLRQQVERAHSRESSERLGEEGIPPFSSQAFSAARPTTSSGRHPEVFDWYRQVLKIRKQGRHQGWLAAERMHLEFDQTLGLFDLRYETEREIIRAIIHLVSNSQIDRKPVAVDLGDFEILAASQQVIHGKHGLLEVAPNQAIILHRSFLS